MSPALPSRCIGPGSRTPTVVLKLDFDGSIVLLTGAPEIGQGSSTVLAQLAAEVLGVDLSRIRVVAGDSEVTPKDNGAYSSRITVIVGNAVVDAAGKLKRLLATRRRARARNRPRRRRDRGRDVPGRQSGPGTEHLRKW